MDLKDAGNGGKWQLSAEIDCELSVNHALTDRHRELKQISCIALLHCTQTKNINIKNLLELGFSVCHVVQCRCEL